MPTFPGMHALELLRGQHRQVRKLFGQLDKAEDLDQRRDAFLSLANTLTAHAVMEERLFYPAVYGERSEELLLQAVEEHLSVKRLLLDLLDMDPGHPHFHAKVSVLREQFEHHVSEEESEIFKASRRALDKQSLEELGARMARLFQREMRGEPSAELPEQTHEAADLGWGAHP